MRSQTFISKQYDMQAKRHDKIVTEHTTIQKKLTNLEEEVLRLKKDLKNETIEQSKEAQYRQNNKLEISGIPTKKGENCKDIVMDVVKLMRVNVSLKDIDVVHRLRRGNIIIVFTSRQARGEMWSHERNLKGITIRNLGLEPQNDAFGKSLNGFIFLQESLTFHYKHLFYLTRQRCKEMNIPIRQVNTNRE